MAPARIHDAPRSRLLAALIVAFGALCLLVVAPAAHAQPRSAKSAAPATAAATEAVDAEKIFGAIVKVTVHAVPDARSSASLGRRARRQRRRHRRQRPDPHDRLPDRRGRGRHGRRQQGALARRAGRGLRPCDGLRPAAHDRAARRQAGDAGRFDPGRRARARDDRVIGRRQRLVRLHRQQAGIRRQLGIRAGPGDLYQSSDAQLERGGPVRPRRETAGRGFAHRPRRHRRRAESPRQHVRADRPAEAHPGRPRQRRTARRSRAAVAGRERRRSAGATRRHARIAGRPRRPCRRESRRHHPRRGRRGRAHAARVLSQGMEPRGCRNARFRSSCCRASTSTKSPSSSIDRVEYFKPRTTH